MCTHPLDGDVLFEAVVGRIPRVDPEIADAAGDREIQGGVVGHLGVGTLLDVADQAVHHLGGVGVRHAVRRMHRDAGLVLPRVVDDLADERRQPVDRQHRPAFQLALAAHLFRPLLPQPRESQVVQRLAPVLGLGIGGRFEGGAGFGEDVVVGQVWPSRADAR
jgi:hypothetical protein